MKTIPVSLIVASFLVPMAAIAQPMDEAKTPARRGGEDRQPTEGRFLEVWKTADVDRDGSLSRQEFYKMPRIQNLPEDKREGLFKRLDKDGDGKLARGELGRLGKHREGEQGPMPRLWELDVDKSGGVSFEEFKAGRLSKKLPLEKQEALFRRLDTNGDGSISPADKPVPRAKQDGVQPRPGRPDGERPDGSRMEPRQIIRQLDQNADGALSFDEFRAGPAVIYLTEDEQEDRFDALDKNHDLKITAADFPPLPERGQPKHPKESPPVE